jgi:hypothetical protein
MIDDQGRFVDPSYPPAELRYAIRSARAVVEALIARDGDAAEEAALRTCRDCDLLIRFIRELALLLRDPLNQQVGFDRVTTAALVRRADHVLALVDASPSPNLPSVTADCDQNTETVQAREQRDGSSGKKSCGGAPLAAPHGFRGLTVASVGLRVRLVPVETNDSTNAPTEGQRDDASPPIPGEEAPGMLDR